MVDLLAEDADLLVASAPAAAAHHDETPAAEEAPVEGATVESEDGLAEHEDQELEAEAQEHADDGSASSQWVSEGHKFDIFPEHVEGTTTPLYAVFNHAEMDYVYTTSYHELEAMKKSRWATYKGVVGHVAVREAPGLIPLYRLWSKSRGDHVLTTDLSAVSKAAHAQDTEHHGEDEEASEQHAEMTARHEDDHHDLLVSSDPAHAVVEDDHAAEEAEVAHAVDAHAHAADAKPAGPVNDYALDGIVGFVPFDYSQAVPESELPVNSGLTPLYQFFSPGYGHFYTADPAYDGKVSHSLGTATKAPSNPNSPLEKLLDAQWYTQGTAAFVHGGKVEGSVPLYRFRNGDDHTALTTAAEEYAPAMGWKLDGIVGYVFATAAVPGTVPLRRFFDGKDHIYLTHVINVPEQFAYQGVQCWVWPSAVPTDPATSTLQGVIERPASVDEPAIDEDPAEVQAHQQEKSGAATEEHH